MSSPVVTVDELPVCWFCGKPITELSTGFAELYDRVTGGYPHDPAQLSVRYSHGVCGEEEGYNIDFLRLLSDGVGDEPRSWYGHLMEKRWFDPMSADLLDNAYEAATLVREHQQRRLTGMRSVMQSIPRRPPRTPENPRNIRPAMRARVMERDGFRCRRCGCGPDDSPLVVDHVVPVAKGGTAAFDNLQTLCRICNAGKSDAAPHPHDLGASA